MCNSPATFQAMMDSIFSDMIEGCMVIVYLDLCKQSRRPSETYKNGTPTIMGT
jgi:hypothetical protein